MTERRIADPSSTTSVDVRGYVESLFKGSSLDDIEDSILPLIRKNVQAKRHMAIVKGDSGTKQRADDLLIEINLRAATDSAISEKSSFLRKSIDGIPPDMLEEAENFVEKALKCPSQKLDDSIDPSAVKSVLKMRIQWYSDAKDYVMSQKHLDILTKIQENPVLRPQNDTITNGKKEELVSLVKRRRSLVRRSQKNENQYKQKLQRLEEAKRIAENRLFVVYEKKINKFENEKQDILEGKFFRESPKLLQLRSIERASISAYDFESAKHALELGDALEEEERKKYQEASLLRLAKAEMRIKKAHENAITAHETFWSKRFQRLFDKYTSAKEAYERELRVIDLSIEKLKKLTGNGEEYEEESEDDLGSSSLSDLDIFMSDEDADAALAEETQTPEGEQQTQETQTIKAEEVVQETQTVETAEQPAQETQTSQPQEVQETQTAEQPAQETQTSQPQDVQETQTVRAEGLTQETQTEAAQQSTHDAQTTEPGTTQESQSTMTETASHPTQQTQTDKTEEAMQETQTLKTDEVTQETQTTEKKEAAVSTEEAFQPPSLSHTSNGTDQSAE